MATDASLLTDVMNAIEALLQGLADGSGTVSYTISGRTRITTDPAAALDPLFRAKAILEKSVSSASTGVFRVAQLSRPTTSAS